MANAKPVVRNVNPSKLGNTTNLNAAKHSVARAKTELASAQQRVTAAKYYGESKSKIANLEKDVEIAKKSVTKSKDTADKISRKKAPAVSNKGTITQRADKAFAEAKAAQDKLNKLESKARSTNSSKERNALRKEATALSNEVQQKVATFEKLKQQEKAEKTSSGGGSAKSGGGGGGGKRSYNRDGKGRFA